jgi:hypothetical protein
VEVDVGPKAWERRGVGVHLGLISGQQPTLKLGLDSQEEGRGVQQRRAVEHNAEASKRRRQGDGTRGTGEFWQRGVLDFR